MVAYVNPSLSAEMLGAYLEGNLSDNENALVHDIISNDSELSSIASDVVEFETDWNANIYEDYPEFNDMFSIPVIESVTEEDVTVLPETHDVDNEFFVSSDSVDEADNKEFAIEDHGIEESSDLSYVHYADADDNSEILDDDMETPEDLPE